MDLILLQDFLRRDLNGGNRDPLALPKALVRGCVWCGGGWHSTNQLCVTSSMTFSQGSRCSCMDSCRFCHGEQLLAPNAAGPRLTSKHAPFSLSERYLASARRSESGLSFAYRDLIGAELRNTMQDRSRSLVGLQQRGVQGLEAGTNAVLHGQR